MLLLSPRNDVVGDEKFAVTYQFVLQPTHHMQIANDTANFDVHANKLTNYANTKIDASFWHNFPAQFLVHSVQFSFHPFPANSNMMQGATTPTKTRMECQRIFLNFPLFLLHLCVLLTTAFPLGMCRADSQPHIQLPLSQLTNDAHHQFPSPQQSQLQRHVRSAGENRRWHGEHAKAVLR